MLVHEIAQRLQDVGGIGTVGTDIFRHELPEAPENAIAVAQGSPGAAPSDVVMGEGAASIAADNEVFEVLVRNKDRAAAWSKALAVRDALDEKPGVFPNTTPGGAPANVTYHRIAKVSGPTEFRLQTRPQAFHVELRFAAKKERSS